MTDLVAFLLQRISDDERVAKAASTGDGYLNWDTPSTAIVQLAGGDLDGLVHMPRLASLHVVRWDPARVLAECATKRAIIEEHHISTRRSRDWQNLELADGERKYEKFVDEETCAVCGWVREIESPWMEKYSGAYPVPEMAGCLTLRLLAAPFRSHSDFDPAWETP